ncbi:MAG: ASKHA domain-containing protein [Planctomycetota bacterium]|jgi:uncharacterized 2Fe-2S/4Fe-4S cluster protein (DUF4445 family)
MRHFSVTFEPDGKKISIHENATLFEAAARAGIVLNSICGGKGTCKKCLVKLQPQDNQVLACQHQIKSDLTITIPEESRFFEQKILEYGIDTKTKLRYDIYEKYKQTAVTKDILGLAVDIGTTTVVAKLIDLKDGRCRATQAANNPQAQFGDDVISRIAHAQTNDGLNKLQKIIIDCINQLIAQLCKKASITAECIYEVCVVGNTTMNHIFLKLPVAQLGQAPYSPSSVNARDLEPEQLGLQINPAGNIHTAELIAGFVGSDITAVALATGIDLAEETTLVVDIGTNGEIVLGTKDKLYAASCAAGPAFEGARISCGSRAAEGAIQAVVANDNDIDLDVIGNCPARSICGSGLIDAVAVLLDLGIIETNGRFAETKKLGNLPPAITSRICEVQGKPAFCLAETDERKVALTQEDIRQVQLAKAAIRAGTKLLQQKLGLRDSDIKHIFLAGAFGNYIRRESALRIGLLPRVHAESINFVGNAASSGAQIILLSQQCRIDAKNLARKMEYIEIANEPDFQTVFTDSMKF